MIRILTILAAVAALAVSAAPASAGTPEAATGACNVRGFMDYTDDSCMARSRSDFRARGLSTRWGGEVVSSDAMAKARRPGVASFSIDVGTSEALKHITDGTSNTLARSQGGPNGIIAILIG